MFDPTQIKNWIDSLSEFKHPVKPVKPINQENNGCVGYAVGSLLFMIAFIISKDNASESESWLPSLLGMIAFIYNFITNKNVSENNDSKARRYENELRNYEKEIKKIESDRLYIKNKIVKYFLDSIIKYENEFFSSKSYLRYSTLNKNLKTLQPLISLLFEYKNKVKDDESAKQIKEKLLSFIKNAESKRIADNEQYVKNEIEFARKLLPDYLNNQQLESIVINEDNNLVIAGAGTGKTTCIANKIKYLQIKYSILPEEILLISFTNKSANSLSERMENNNIKGQTFDSFAKNEIYRKIYNEPDIFNPDGFEQLVKNLIEENRKDLQYQGLLNDFFNKHLKDTIDSKEFSVLGDYFQYLKDFNIRSYKMVPYGRNETLARERMKSLEEMQIANFLFLNGIKYEYEKKYKIDLSSKTHRNYKPDFYLPKYDIYIEHFALDINSNVPHYFKIKDWSYDKVNKKYNEERIWKKEIHQKYNTELVETFSFQFKENSIFKILEMKLEELNVKFESKTNDEIWQIIKTNAKYEYDQFIKLLCTFINLQKSNNIAFDDIAKKCKAENLLRERNDIFLKIYKPIFEGYKEYLDINGEKDFTDIIATSTQLIKENKVRLKYKYVIIDEFQDISIGRYELMKSILDQNNNVILFCVGDDWQSIYRFGGSDVSIFNNFENYFSIGLTRGTRKSNLDETHRFGEPLIKLSSDFIRKNPNQSKKIIKSSIDTKKTDYEIVYSKNEPDKNDDSDALTQIIISISKVDTGKIKPNISIIGRYSFDINRIIDSDKIKVNTQNNTVRYNNIEIPYYTVHKFKGEENDYIIILNCNSGKYGFPSLLSDDKVLNMVLKETDKYENSEERRLFYVALSRAKEKLYIITNENTKSNFVIELESLDNDQKIKCPICLKGDIVIRTNKLEDRTFKSCSNYTFGCNYSESIK